MRSLLISMCAASLVLVQSLSPLSASAQQQQQGQPILAPHPIVSRSTGTGSLICSAAIGTSCGTTKADYVGTYKLNLNCDSGFYDPVYGGTCWKCPDETDGKGGWIRSATDVTGDDACWRVPKESLVSATKVKTTALAWQCPSGSFWDMYDWGGCWSCPSDHPRRTAYPVYSSNACATPTNETRSAVFLKFNGCPKPDTESMKLKGKRLPGKPFLDIAGGWNQGVAAGGCYACPVTDEEGNILITQRNASPIYGENQGCDVLFKWKPGYFPEPGMAGLASMREFLAENKLLAYEKITAGLYFQAKSRGMNPDSAEAKDWVAKQWQQIAVTPYRNEAFRTLVYQNLLMAAALAPEQRMPAQGRLIAAFEDYIKQRRTYLAQMGLAMYDAWKAYDDKAKNSVKRSSLQVAFDYGTVPLDFHGTLSAVTVLGAGGTGVAGALAASFAYTQQVAAGGTGTAIIGKVATVETVDPTVRAMQAMTRIPIRNDTNFVSLMPKMSMGTSSRLSDVLKPLNLFKGTVAANAALAGATIITVAFAIIQSVAIDQFIAIQTARPKLEAALAGAQQPVNLNQILSQQNGSDLALYYWAKAMESDLAIEDPQVVSWAAAAHQQAQSVSYRLAGAQ